MPGVWHYARIEKSIDITDPDNWRWFANKLGNLIRNAIDNTDAGKIEVTLFGNGFLVKDTGTGIESNEIEYIVKRHHHSPNSSGFGPGLYLVQSICDSYMLNLDIKSTVGEGS